MLELNAQFQRQLPPGVPFEWFMGLTGEVFRDMPDRKTLRFELGGKGYFIKMHTGVGWGEIFKNLFQGRLPV
ncbi:MAG: lipopolysaccharide core heptose(I) kinase RfaP, partial [Pseudomonadota bacterium]